MLTAIELRARRAVEKLSQKAFADKLGIKSSYLNKLENGHFTPSKKIESKYDELYGGKRLISITISRGVECPYCHEITPREKLNDPKDELNTIYHCLACDHYYTIGESWGLHYRA